MSVASVIIAFMSHGSGCPNCGQLNSRRPLPAIYAAGIRVARTRTTYGARSFVAVGRSVTVSASTLSHQVRPPAQPRSSRLPWAVSAVCAVLLFFLAFGATAASADERAAAGFVMSLLAMVGVPATVLAVVRGRLERSRGPYSRRASAVWGEGSLCQSCLQVLLPVPGAAKEAVVPVGGLHRALAEIAAGRWPLAHRTAAPS